MEFLKATPKWLIVLLSFYITVLFSYAIFDGRSVTFWPPTIGSKDSHNDKPDLNIINNANATTEKPFTPQDLIKQLPADVQRFTIKDTADEILKRITLISEQNSQIEDLKNKVKVIEGLESDFIFRVLSFHKEASCYGDSLNFTYIAKNESTKKCTAKKTLAKHFLGFMAEINFYDGDVLESPDLAENELKRYQDSKDFGHKGYYGRDVFKWIIIDYNGIV